MMSSAVAVNANGPEYTLRYLGTRKTVGWHACVTDVHSLPVSCPFMSVIAFNIIVIYVYAMYTYNDKTGYII
jgi:hypothetical protein